MTLPVGDLFAAIERNDGQAVSRYLRTASEAERRAVSGKVRALCSRNWNFHGDRSATVVAMLGTAGGVRPIAQVIGPLGVQQWTEEAIAVLRERKPAWLPDLPRALLTGNEFRNNWCFVRDLVRAGLVPKPDVPEYIIRMPHGLASRAWLSPWNRSIVTIEDQLRADPELLGNEVFELFRIEGSATSLYWADGALSQGHEYRDGKYVKIAPRPEATWRSTLARLARGGLIDFNRLLDEAITVFLRDLRPTHFGWYVDMHDELAPTLDEMAAREAQYLRLLAADTSLGVGVGQRALEQLLRADRLDVESFVHAAGPALARGEKGIVVKQMKLLDLALKQRPDLGATVHEALSPALAHERREIQEAARALAERLSGGKNLGTAPSTGLGPPSQPNTDLETGVLARAARLVKHPVWGPQIQSSLTAIRAGEAPPASTISAAAGRSLQPISDPEEVVDAFIRLVESAGDPVLIERAIAGAVRTGLPAAQRARIAAPLAKRAREQLPAWPSGLTSGDVRAMAASVAFTWSTGTRVTASFDRNYTDFAIRHSSLDEHLQPVTPTGVMAVRCIEAIDLIAKGAQTELLAEPTHERGAIDPGVFLERLQKSYGGWFSSGAPRFDLEVAALRIRPGALDASVGKLPGAIKDQTTALLSDVPAWIETEVGGMTHSLWFSLESPSWVADRARSNGLATSAIRSEATSDCPERVSSLVDTARP